jgi:hypothetical protein
MAIFGASPIPNQMMNRGMRPTNVTVRSICTGASTRSSPIRNSPETRVSPVPIAVPNTSPNATRRSEVPMADGGEPSLTRSQPTCAIRPGEASTSGVNAPVVLRSCHRASSRSGPAVRRGRRGTRRWREETGTTGWSSGAVRSECVAPGLGNLDIPEISGPGELGGAWLMLMTAPRRGIAGGTWGLGAYGELSCSPTTAAPVTGRARQRRLQWSPRAERKRERASAAAATRGGGHPQQVDVTARGEQG